MWQAIVHAFAELIQYLYHLTVAMGIPNYGLAIILVTILIKVAMYPLTNKQMKSMRQMQQIQPKMKALQERFKDDPQRMQKEVLALYKENKVSPLSGCLPLLVQLPILIAFYRALYQLKYAVPEHAAFLWVPSLSQPDPYYGFAVLAGVTTFIQQKISAVDATDPTQKTMLYIMPLFIAWMAATFPAGLALYWVMFNLLSIAQQLWVNSQSKPLQAAGVGPVVEEGAVAMEGVLEDENLSRDKGGTDKSGGRRKKRKKR